jgi:apolipoprotein N-acyltransferase
VPELGRLQWALIGVVWLLTAFGSGAALAWLYKRLHPELDFFKLWAMWTAVLSVVVGALFLLGVV